MSSRHLWPRRVRVNLYAGNPPIQTPWRRPTDQSAEFLRATSQFALLHDCNNLASGLSPMAPNLRSNQPTNSNEEQQTQMHDGRSTRLGRFLRQRRGPIVG